MREITGTRIIDISELLQLFEAPEGSVESYTGPVGEGKTYGANKRAVEDLLRGSVVYTSWKIDLSGFVGDQRKNIWVLLRKFFKIKPVFFDVDIQKNWHYIDYEDPETWVINGRYYSKFVDFITDITDAIVYLDEGQDIFDSYEGTSMSKGKRKVITRTRHLNKTLVIISQRYQAIPPTARANVKTFYRHTKVDFFGFILFKVYATTEIDNQHMPVFDNAELVEWYFSKQKYFDSYNSWYLRGGIEKSQEVHFSAYYLSFKERLLLLLSLLISPLKRRYERAKFFAKSLGVKRVSTTIKNDTSLTEGKVSSETKLEGSIRRAVGGAENAPFKRYLLKRRSRVLTGIWVLHSDLNGRSGGLVPRGYKYLKDTYYSHEPILCLIFLKSMGISCELVWIAF